MVLLELFSIHEHCSCKESHINLACSADRRTTLSMEDIYRWQHPRAHSFVLIISWPSSHFYWWIISGERRCSTCRHHWHLKVDQNNSKPILFGEKSISGDKSAFTCYFRARAPGFRSVLIRSQFSFFTVQHPPRRSDWHLQLAWTTHRQIFSLGMMVFTWMTWMCFPVGRFFNHLMYGINRSADEVGWALEILQGNQAEPPSARRESTLAPKKSRILQAQRARF